MPLLALAWTVGGAAVYYAQTGSSTVGDDLSNMDALLWFGRLFAWGAVSLVGPRGSLARLWHTAVDVLLDFDGLTRIDDGQRQRLPWADIAAMEHAHDVDSSRSAVIVRTPSSSLSRPVTLLRHSMWRFPGRASTC